MKRKSKGPFTPASRVKFTTTSYETVMGVVAQAVRNLNYVRCYSFGLAQAWTVETDYHAIIEWLMKSQTDPKTLTIEHA